MNLQGTHSRTLVQNAPPTQSLLVPTLSMTLHCKHKPPLHCRYDPYQDGGKRHHTFGTMTVVELLKVLPRVTRLLLASTHIPLDPNTLSLPLAQTALSLTLEDNFQSTLDVMDGLNRLTVRPPTVHLLPSNHDSPH